MRQDGLLRTFAISREPSDRALKVLMHSGPDGCDRVMDGICFCLPILVGNSGASAVR
jgi:hypothetical protein